jgi:putative transposase
MSYVRIWVHVVFSTRNHEQYLTSDLRSRLIDHIKVNCRNKEIFLDSIGGWSDHLHLLISLGREQNIARVMMLIKGESAHWINKQKLFRGKFYWQDDYYAISVSESQVQKVRAYIKKQEEHHRAVPFVKELETLQMLTRRLG